MTSTCILVPACMLILTSHCLVSTTDLQYRVLPVPYQLAWSQLTWPGWPTTKPQGPSCAHLLTTKVMDADKTWFPMGAGRLSSVPPSCFCGKSSADGAPSTTQLFYGQICHTQNTTKGFVKETKLCRCVLLYQGRQRAALEDYSKIETWEEEQYPCLSGVCVCVCPSKTRASCSCHHN